MTLLPAPQAGDKNRFTEAKIALAKGPPGQAGNQLVDLGNGRVETVCWLSGLINSLSYRDLDTPLACKDMMRQANSNLAAAKMSTEARGPDNASLQSCGKDLEL